MGNPKNPWARLLLFATAFLLCYYSYNHYFARIPSQRTTFHGALSRQKHSKATCKSNLKALKRVAIVGAGSAGSSTAFYIDVFRDPCQPVDITIFERDEHVGGRSTTVDAFGDRRWPLELGASIFVKANKNLVSAVDFLGLETESAGSRRPRALDQALGVWDGAMFQYLQPEGESQWKTISRLIWRYGLAPIKTQRLMQTTVDTFLKMYEAPYFPFPDLSAVVEELGLSKVTASSGDRFLLDNGISAAFIHDIVQASTRVNYAQNANELHALEALVCMATDGAVAVKDGNWQIFAGMIRESKATLHLKSQVHAVTTLSDGKLNVTTSNMGSDLGSQDQHWEAFDAMVLAAPFQFSNITFRPQLDYEPRSTDYVKLHVTLFTSPHRLSAGYFGLDAAQVPEVVLTTSAADPIAAGPEFLSVSTLQQVFNAQLSRHEYAYKVFSLRPLSSNFISRLLGFPDPGSEIYDISPQDIGWLHEKVWFSYPHLTPRDKFEPLMLAENLYYTSAIEDFISTMETSSLMGANVASQLVNSWNTDKATDLEHEL